jgi:hypothetical protein
MSWIATFLPFKYPFRNLIAILNETALIYAYIGSSCMVSPDINLTEWKSYANHIALTFTVFMIIQAVIYVGA